MKLKLGSVLLTALVCIGSGGCTTDRAFGWTNEFVTKQPGYNTSQPSTSVGQQTRQ